MHASTQSRFCATAPSCRSIFHGGTSRLISSAFTCCNAASIQMSRWHTRRGNRQWSIAVSYGAKRWLSKSACRCNRQNASGST